MSHYSNSIEVNSTIKHNSRERDNNNLIERRVQTSIRSYIQSLKMRAIINLGYIDQVKAYNNTRILVLNPNKLIPSNEEKINIMIYSSIDQ